MSVAETLDDVLGLIADDVKLLRDAVKAQPRALGIDEQRGLTAYARVLSEVADMEAKRKAPQGDIQSLMERASKIPELRDLVARQLQANGHRPTRGGEGKTSDRRMRPAPEARAAATCRMERPLG